MSGRNKVRFFFFLRGTSKRFFSLFSAFQGGAEHSVPVVISKIFKDQVGKRVFKKCHFFNLHFGRQAKRSNGEPELFSLA